MQNVGLGVSPRDDTPKPFLPGAVPACFLSMGRSAYARYVALCLPHDKYRKKTWGTSHFLGAHTGH